jgi:hypothetical protein
MNADNLNELANLYTEAVKNGKIIATQAELRNLTKGINI